MYEADSLLEAIDLAKSGRESMVICPAHMDKQASLHVTHGDTHPVVFTCHAGCTADQIMAEAGLDMSLIMAEREETKTEVWTPVRDKSGNFLTASNVYPYHDEDGNLLYEVVRVQLPQGGKTFRQRQPDSTERFGWKWNMDGARRVLYRLPEVLRAKDEGRLIWLVEGEKDVEALRRLGEVATTSPMGAGNGKWIPEYTRMLAGATVQIIADADATGRAHARTVREELKKAGCNVTLCEAMEGCKDVTDHIQAGHTLAQLVETMPEQDTTTITYGVDVLDVIKRDKAQVEFIVPGLLAAGERLMVTGLEGRGKSTYLRQFAACVAAGLDPHSWLPIPPQKVLFIDAENHPDQIQGSWEHLLGLCARHGAIMPRGKLIVLEAWDDDIDLTSEEGEAWLIERMHAEQPKLLVLGPIYNLTADDVSSHVVVGRLKQVINRARALYGSAVLMEHHAPHKGPMDSVRSVRPYGSSTFLKWPDYGYGFKPMEGQKEVYEFEKLRYDRVRGRGWPTHMRNGVEGSDEFPWVSCFVDNEGNVLG